VPRGARALTRASRGRRQAGRPPAAAARRDGRGGAKGATTNAHLAEERGAELADDVDEEALYSSVQRAAPEGPPKPPAWAFRAC
jgi:hypothetical protein